MTTYILNETQTHYYVKESQEKDFEKYEQCLTCRNVTFDIYHAAFDGGYPMGCSEEHVPVLPACKHKEDTGLTLRKL
jgi:hypothetical protein